MRRPSRLQRRLLTGTLALLAFAVAYYGGTRYRDESPPVAAISGLAIRPPAPLPALPDGDRQGPLRREMLLDHWSLLMLDPGAGDVRSPALTRLLQIHNRLAAEPELQRRIAFIYLPWELDRRAQEAIEGLGDNIRALAGDPRSVAETFRLFGVEREAGGTALYLIGPETRLHALFTPGEDIATIAKDLTVLVTDKQ